MKTLHTHREKENSNGKKFKIKPFASGCDETCASQKHTVERNEKLSGDPLTAILASYIRSFLWDLWSFELERSASDSPSIPYFFNVDKLNGFQIALEAKRQ